MYRQMAFGLVGGLGLLLYGMDLMGDGLQKAAGDRMKRLLEALTGRLWKGIAVGAAVTAVIQSSTATTVMLVSFVNSGLMTLTQAFAVIMGANIGTTVTAQMISFNLSEWALPAVGAGCLLRLVAKRRMHKYIGQLLVGFGLVFLGMVFMRDAVRPLRDLPMFETMIENLQSYPFLAVVVGVIMTAMVQSSSASTGILLAMASEGVITLSVAIPVLFGCNIGTCVTAILASIGTTRTAKRTAVAHVLFNTVGAVAFIFLARPFESVVRAISGTADLQRLVANSHTLFNIGNTLIWLPFTGLMVTVVNRIVKGPEHEMVVDAKYLDQRMINTPSVALEMAVKEIAHMGDLTREMMDRARRLFFEGTVSELEIIESLEDRVDSLRDETITYLSTILSENSLTEKQSARLAGLMHAVSDIERIADHAHNIGEYSMEKANKNLPFSPQACEELTLMYAKVVGIFEVSMKGLHQWDAKPLQGVFNLENEIDADQKRLRSNHIIRLNRGTCYPGSGIIFVETINNLERIADHCVNIAEVVLEDAGRGVERPLDSPRPENLKKVK